MYKQLETYNFRSYFFAEVKSSWTVQNNQSAIDAINKLNIRALWQLTTF